MRLLCHLCLLLLFITSCAVPPPRSDRASQIHALVQPLLDDFPGLTLAVGQGDEVVFTEGYGWADVETQQRMTGATPLRVYSLSKPWTGAAGLTLVERGQVDLNADVRQWIPALSDKAYPITLYQLATHTSGIRHYREGEAESARICRTSDEAVALFAQDPLVFEPGTQRLYSSWGYVLLSAALSKATGQPFTDLMEQAVFEPLGMTKAGYASPEAEQAAGVKFYEKTPNGFTPVNASASCKLGAGGFLATASDVVRFYLGLLNKRLLSDRSRSMLLQSEASGLIREQGVSPGGRAQVWVHSDERLVVALIGNAQGKDVTFDEVFEVAEQIGALFASGQE